MEEYNIFYGCLDKIETLCRENDLTVDLTSTSYPFTIIVRSYRPMYEQVAIPETEDRVIQGGTISMKYIDGELVISQPDTSKLQARCKIKSKSYSRTFTAHIRSISSGMRWNAACSRPPLQAQIGRPPGPHERRTPASFLREAMMIPRIDCTAGGGPMPVSS